MSFSVRYVPAVLFTLFSLAVTVSAQSASPQAAKAPQGSVSGRVTIKDKGAAGVAVGLRKSDMTNPYEQFLRATTDHDGFYRIANIAPGTYEVAPSAPGFVAPDNQRGKTVVVGDDENVENINFTLVRGGVVTGKITDADGRPIILHQVNLFQADALGQPAPPQGPQRQVFPTNNTTTDDRGIYRMYGIRAGRYKVAAGRSDETFSPGFGQMRATYKQVFHPDVSEQAKATIIEVTEGSEATNVDIKLGPALQTFSVTGRVVDSERNVPLTGIQFAFQRMVGQQGEFLNTPVSSNAQGEFYAEGLVPGKYGIFLFQEMNNSDLRAEPVTFEIIDQDVSNVILKFSKGASLSGVVVIETEDKTALQKLSHMRLLAYPIAAPGTGGGSFGQSSSAMVGADGSFRLGALPAGNISVQLTGTRGIFDMKGFAISRIERDGVALPRTIPVKEGEQIGGIRVVVAYGNGTIRGVVKLENGSLPTGAQIFVRLTKAGEGIVGIRPGQVDSRGHFVMDGIPPGNYEVSVQFFGPGVPRVPPDSKREVSVQNGVVTDVMLTVDLTTQPKP